MDHEIVVDDDDYAGGGHYDGSNLKEYRGHQHESSQLDDDDGWAMDMDDPVHDDGWIHGDSGSPYSSDIHDVVVNDDDDGFLGGGDPESTTNHFHERHNYYYDFNDDDKNSWFDAGHQMLRSFRRRLFPWYDDNFRNSTNSSTGIWIAVFVVLAFQFWPQIQDIFFRVETVGLYQTVEDMFVQAGNTIRAQTQLTIEFGRAIQLYMMKWTNIRGIFSGGGTGRGRGTNSKNNNNNNRDRRHLSPSSEFGGEGSTSNSLLDGIWGRGSSSATNFGSGFFFSSFDEQPDSPPPLVTLVTTPNGNKEWEVVEDDDNGDSNGDSENNRDGSTNEGGIASSSSAPENVGRTDFELEPAFLDEKDYPPGWLLYHPVLGVVSKEEADRYDSQTRNDRNFSEQPSPPERQDKQIVAEGKYVIENLSAEVQNYNKSCGSNGSFDHTNKTIRHYQKQESGSISVEIYDNNLESNNNNDEGDNGQKKSSSHNPLNMGTTISSIPVAATGT
mmetsp:Transcript_4832/g.12302  ORF Transcript_4832/g.12302 Transcript_4832/m.12302 type:complete len:499 (+) Transcript_4832:124-1620(+)